MRIEAWNNVLQDKKYLEMLKNSGNALRFYYGQIDLSPDYGQIYQYDVEAFPFRMYNIYALDPRLSGTSRDCPARIWRRFDRECPRALLRSGLRA